MCVCIVGAADLRFVHMVHMANSVWLLLISSRMAGKIIEYFLCKLKFDPNIAHKRFELFWIKPVHHLQISRSWQFK